MGNIKEEYIIDSFVDYSGKEKRFILAAISEDLTSAHAPIVTIITNDGETVGAKRLMFGISVCDSNDQFDEEIGKRIAKGRALNPKSRIHTLISTDAGLINTSVVKAALKQEAEYLKVNPGNYIRSYDRDKYNFECRANLYKKFDNMKVTHKEAINSMVAATDKEFQEMIEIAKGLR